MIGGDRSTVDHLESIFKTHSAPRSKATCTAAVRALATS
jgi:hypothetical protein